MDTRAPSSSDSAGEPSAADGCRTHAERAPAADAVLLLPVTNRGVIVATDKPSTIEIGIHWLSITAFTNPSNLVRHVMGELLRQPLSSPEEWDKVFADTGRSGRRYKKIFAGPLGMRLYGFPGTQIHCHMEIPGEALEHLGQVATVDFLASMQELTHTDVERSEKPEPEPRPVKWRVTRIDIAFDRVPFTPRQAFDAWVRGDVRCAASRKSYKWIESEDGNTLYIGSRTSDRFARIYDRRGFTRVEMELKGPWGEGIALLIARAPHSEWRDLVLGYLRQFLDFVDARTGGSITRAELLPWWAAFAAGAERASKRFERGDAGLEILDRSKRYLNRLLPSLCVLKQGLGVSLDELCEGVALTLSPKHQQRLAEIQRALGFA